MSAITPFQTIGPYFQVMLRSTPRGHDTLAGDATPGEHITIEGALLDGSGAPVSDALVEIWQADTEGRYRHPADERAPEALDVMFDGYGRVHVQDDGSFAFDTIRPGSVPGPDGRPQAPHILVSVMGRGILTRYITRLYFEDEPANAGDAILALVPEGRRSTLLARRTAPGRYRFDIRIQGAGETVFFEA